MSEIKTAKRGTWAERLEARPAAYPIAKAERDAEQERIWIAELDAAPESWGVCYFIGCDEGLVKIGYTHSLFSRFGQIRNTTIYKLSILATATGGRSRESYYHRKFAEHRAFGEWFTRCPEIEAEIALLNAKADAA